VSNIPVSEYHAVNSAIKTYQDTPGFVQMTNVLCAIALQAGDVTNCSPTRQVDAAQLLDIDAITLFVASGPVEVDGLTISPNTDHSVIIAPQLQMILSDDATVTLNDQRLTGQGTPKLQRGLALSFRDVNAPLTLNGADDRTAVLGQFNLHHAIPGLKGLTPGNGTLTFVRDTSDNRYIRMDVSLALPSEVSLGDGGPPTIAARYTQSNSVPVALHDLHTTLQVCGGCQDALNFGGSLLGLHIDDVRVDYGAGAQQVLELTGAITIGDAGIFMKPPPDNGLVWRDGDLVHAGANFVFSCPALCPPDIFPGVTLNELSFGIDRNPTALDGGGLLKVVDLIDVRGGLVVAFPSEDAPYTLDRSRLHQLPGDYGSKTFTSLLVALAGNATVNLPVLGDEPIANVYFTYAFPGYVAFGGGVHWDLLGVVSFDGGLSGEVNAVNKRFNFAGRLQSCVADVICAGAFGVVSSQGAGACFVVGPVSVGGGVQWGRAEPYIWPFDGCKWSRFTEDHVYDGAIRAHRIRASTAPYEVKVGAGDPGRAIRIDGTDEAPAVLVTGPGGQRLASSTGHCTTATDKIYNGDTCLTIGGHIRIMRSPQAKQTVVGIENPAPGSYTITPVVDSAAFARVFTARDGDAPTVTGKVTGTGVSRTLTYHIADAADERVTFLDVGPQGAREIGTATGGVGRMPLTTAPGSGTHRIEALFERAGLPLPMLGGSAAAQASSAATGSAAAAPASYLTIARFKPPRPIRPGTVKKLRIARRGTALLVKWRRARGAQRYSVVMRRDDGSTRSSIVRAPRLRIAGVPRVTGGRVTVRAIGSDSRSGRAARARFGATAKRRTVQRKYPVSRR
jgi:hypothetical protein